MVVTGLDSHWVTGTVTSTNCCRKILPVAGSRTSQELFGGELDAFSEFREEGAWQWPGPRQPRPMNIGAADHMASRSAANIDIRRDARGVTQD